MRVYTGAMATTAGSLRFGLILIAGILLTPGWWSFWDYGWRNFQDWFEAHPVQLSIAALCIAGQEALSKVPKAPRSKVLTDVDRDLIDEEIAQEVESEVARQTRALSEELLNLRREFGALAGRNRTN